MKKLILPLLLIMACSKEPILEQQVSEISDYSQYIGSYDYQGTTIELDYFNSIAYHTNTNGIVRSSYFIFDNNTFSDYIFAVGDTVPFTFRNDSLIINDKVLVKN